MNARTSSLSPTILQRIADADKSAVSDCLKVYGNFVWRTVKNQVRRNENIETIVEDVFKDIWRYAKRFDAAKLTENDFILMLIRHRLRQKHIH